METIGTGAKKNAFGNVSKYFKNYRLQNGKLFVNNENGLKTFLMKNNENSTMVFLG